MPSGTWACAYVGATKNSNSKNDFMVLLLSLVDSPCLRRQSTGSPSYHCFVMLQALELYRASPMQLQFQANQVLCDLNWAELCQRQQLFELLPGVRAFEQHKAERQLGDEPVD